jgi:hypothetical protein
MAQTQPPSHDTVPLMAAIKHLRVNLGDHLLYGPLPCLIINGCNNFATIRTAFNVSNWATMAFGHSYSLVRNSFRLVDQMLIDRGEGGLQTDFRCRLPMTDRVNPGASMTMSSGGLDKLPSSVKLLKLTEERIAAEAIIESSLRYGNSPGATSDSGLLAGGNSATGRRRRAT